MASTNSFIAAQILPPHSKAARAPMPTRRQCLLLLTATTALRAAELPARAQDIPLFGLRKSLRKVEEEAEEIVKEGFEAADKGIAAAEKGIEVTERGVVAAEKEIETVLAFGGLAQAGVVAGAEVLAVVIASSIVNGILGPEAQKS
ncbi:uncharacterized protein LOC130989868 [Salvia miltiorrhiza]|uniref:uncharacterized protein LOC130989868 n=1 Tax=Salvia miltiorrhiza TaxID=226208 RepID=UPI0025AC3F09|nr:uncharacterized protein LOC130989868 [Salvia miltiorrhiza]